MREASVLVTAVVPRPKRLTLGSSSSRVVPLRRAASSAAARTPRPISPVVVGALARHVLVPSVRTQSVKVPPTSMPMQMRTMSAMCPPCQPLNLSNITKYEHTESGEQGVSEDPSGPRGRRRDSAVGAASWGVVRS